MHRNFALIFVLVFLASCSGKNRGVNVGSALVSVDSRLATNAPNEVTLVVTAPDGRSSLRIEEIPSNARDARDLQTFVESRHPGIVCDPRELNGLTGYYFEQKTGTKKEMWFYVLGKKGTVFFLKGIYHGAESEHLLENVVSSFRSR